MAVKQADQITIMDLTDPYSVSLSSYSCSFPGGTTYAYAASHSVLVTAQRGTEDVPVTVGTCTCDPSNKGVSAVVKSGTNGTQCVTVEISVSANTLDVPCVVTIPITVGDDIVFTKTFSISVAKKGADGTSVTVKSTSVTYQASSSGTTKPTGTWSETIPSVSNGQYLWTKTVVTYSDNKSTEAYSVSYKGTNGSNGTSVTVSSTSVTYVASNSGTTTPTSGWGSSIPSVSQGQYLWTKTVVTYSDGKSTTSYSVSRNAVNGTNGADAITMSIISSAGTVFKNSSGSTTLTAVVRKAGVEQSITDAGVVANSLGTVKWYINGTSNQPTGWPKTAKSISVSASDISSTQTYYCQLEG